LPGSVIDRDVTDPLFFDFFLTSHHGAIGTSKPSHYHVLRDDNQFTADEIQDITFKLSFLYSP
ncbi:hypothetical protein HDU93_002686, partial [Gonapodya sp. JEL0774]